MRSNINAGIKLECEHLDKCSDANSKRCNTCMNNMYVYMAKAAELKKESYFTTVFVEKK